MKERVMAAIAALGSKFNATITEDTVTVMYTDAFVASVIVRNRMVFVHSGDYHVAVLPQGLQLASNAGAVAPSAVGIMPTVVNAVLAVVQQVATPQVA